MILVSDNCARLQTRCAALHLPRRKQIRTQGYAIRTIFLGTIYALPQSRAAPTNVRSATSHELRPGPINTVDALPTNYLTGCPGDLLRAGVSADSEMMSWLTFSQSSLNSHHCSYRVKKSPNRKPPGPSDNVLSLRQQLRRKASEEAITI
ncbi:hypothetical protein J6590_034658 [Homalodisca vitripennis]|nr:hypothetical protein J6590_034658 [Homalodisca vitripennis]